MVLISLYDNEMIILKMMNVSYGTPHAYGQIFDVTFDVVYCHTTKPTVLVSIVIASDVQ